MTDEVRKLFTKVMSLISRAVVDARSSDGTYQALWAADRASADVEHMQPQGLHFRVPVDGSGALLSPAGNKSASMLLCASGNTPSDALAAGEGGLHYLGTWRVFVAQDGSLHLGERNATEWAAIASYVDARIAALQSAFDAHTHLHGPYVAAGGPPIPTATPIPLVGAQATVASTSVKVSP